MRTIKILLLALATMLPARALAQELMFYKYEIDQGLSHNTVRCIIQDREGFMWFGTADGLNRFDGKHYKIFPSAGTYEDGSDLGNSSIFSLEQDDQGQIWVGTARGVYVFDPLTEQFRRFDNLTADGGIMNATVRRIVFDDQGKIWFGTAGQGLFIYDIKTGALTQTRKYGPVISDISRAANGIIYIGTQSGRIIEADIDGNQLRPLYPSVDNLDRGGTNITCIYNDKSTIYCGVGSAGLQAIDKKTGEVTTFRPNDMSHSVSQFRKIFPLNETELLVATDNGLFIFSRTTGEFHLFDTGNRFGISDQSVFDICRDTEGGLWIATEYGGVNYIPRDLRPFGHVIPIYGMNGGGRVITAFQEDPNGNIWVATRDGGLINYNPSRKNMQFFMPSYRQNRSRISYHSLRSLLKVDDKLWVGTYSRGLDVMDTRTWDFVNYQHSDDTTKYTISDNTVNALMRDRNGTIYVGTSWGLDVYRPETDDFVQMQYLGSQASVSDILEDSRGNIWIATSNTGLYRMKRSDNTWLHFPYDPFNPASLPNNRVNSLMEDETGVIWIGTENGLCRFDYGTGAIERVDEESNVLPNRMISAIIQDKQGYIWVSTSGGIYSLDPATDAIMSYYTKMDGLQSNQFNPGAALAASDGTLYFGGINGFNYFNPEEIETNDYIPNVVITDVYVNNTVMPAGTRAMSGIAGAPGNGRKTIKLKPGNNNISIDYVALSYQSPLKNRYSYKLEGWDEYWVYADNATTASYNNLPAGDYTFMVRGSNNDGVENEAVTTLNFSIDKPFYRTAVAYILYLLALLALVGLAYYLVMKAQKNKLQEYAKEQERLSYHSQIDFFTNVAHEIRTPLTLIKVPLEYIISSGEGSPQVKNYLGMIDTNTNNLLNLINQLLDFRKSGGEIPLLSIGRHNMKQLVKEICARFNPVVGLNNLTMELDLPQEEIFFNIDPDAFTKITSNLISNALKYATKKVVVSLRLVGSKLELSVSDDGKGVDMAEREKIFDTFYQPEGSKAGSGIGLYLTKLLVEKHSGTIKVTNNPDGGAVFTVSIPYLMSQPGLVGDVIDDTPNARLVIAASKGEDERERLLLVEDNIEVRTITGDYLEKYYDVLYASNGQEAMDILDEEDVDIIVTDLMMPEMDGYELCELVKSDMRFSHIPVIQLTAKTSLQDRIKGLEYGSDAYIEKPFSLEHLHTQIDNLLENRRRLRIAFSTPPSAKSEPVAAVSTSGAAYNKKDIEFIEKLNAEINKYIQREDISLDHLAESMFMSRSNFYRKIKGLFGVSPNEYVKRYRLKRAADIMVNNECRISDVYVKVGFNSASYFTKCFKKYFGVLPKDYIASIHNGQIGDIDNIK